ncbi:E3 ubiquitin/ISG15 ligase TRIM25-like [Lethenteron reissneri]|uniref:E3 ubiquitin/ISG15 ligase TRIM25-like n=1 Tax=Lethenteron reissneri TaxID=7753 RepID=UPI002AB76078|nr:E3 ubiquitin/ISG15 ligase TRIM25-like [Lethenteron reissneri]
MAAAAAVIFCDHCPEGKTPAVKTCLKCETSFCTEHLAPHLEREKFKEHVLVPPDVNPERKCKRHNKELGFYCKQDASLVCRDCTIAEHKVHNVSTLEQEHETQKVQEKDYKLTSRLLQDQVGEETRAVEDKRREAEASVGRMEATREDVQGSMTGVKEQIKIRCTRLRKALDEDEKAALHRAELKEKELLSQIDKNIAHHKHEISELQAAAARLRTLQEEGDPLTFLQGRLKDTCRKDAPKKTPPPAPTPLDAPTIRSLERVTGKLLPLVYGCSPVLDPNSVHNKLQISPDLKTLTKTSVSQRRPDHPHRFDWYYQALCSDSFSSGQHYWEVDVGGSEVCAVGVAYEAVSRTGREASSLGGNDSSWILLRKDNSYSVRHNGVFTSLPVRDPPWRVGLHLNWEAGLLSFYRAESMEPLYSIHHAFTRPLYPALYVGGKDGETVTILDINRGC